jgi:hypothetical protein
MKLEITLSDAEAKALAYITDDPQFFVDNMVHESCRKANIKSMAERAAESSTPFVDEA